VAILLQTEDPDEPSRAFDNLASFLIGFGMSALIDWVDSRPHWDDSGITAGLLFLGAAFLAFFYWRRPWLVGLAVGFALWWHLTMSVYAGHHFAAKAILTPLLVFIFPLAGAYAGMGLRRVLARA
jgi:hypothetical protein